MTYPRRGVHGSVVEDLGRRIVTGEFGEAATLDPSGLARHYKVSQTVVREALKTLAAKGLLDARPKRGTFVRPRDDWSLLDPDVLRWQLADGHGAPMLKALAEVRAIVEPACARLAALRRTDEEVSALEASLDRMAATVGDPIAHTAADLAFHRLLLTATHNELLARMEVVIAHGLYTRDLLVHSSGARPGFAATHRAVLDAVRRGDPDRAEAAMHALLVQADRDDRDVTTPDTAPGQNQSGGAERS
jgi:GntR family transcriptional regulator, galactonate operon transcriptional repressor